jgi:hypothetical protein
VYPIPPLLRDPADAAARAAGWRIFTGRTYGGVALDTAMCPTCAAPAATVPDVPAADSTEQEPLFMVMPRKSKTRLYVGVAALVAAVGVLLFAAGAAYGSAGDHDKSIGQIRVVEPCTAGQAHANDGRGALGEHGDAFYRCKQTAPGCFQWKWQYDGRPTTGKSWPRPPCPVCSPSPSKPTSASASPSPSGSKSASAAASPSESPGMPAMSSAPPLPDQLPVTGTADVVRLVGIAAAASGAGLLFIFLPRIVRRRTP